jgi:hypothetical protein
VKDWHSGVVAIRVTEDSGDEVIHIVNRADIGDYLTRSAKPPKSPRSPKWRGGEAKTYCGNRVDLSVLGVHIEATETEVNSDPCIAKFAEARVKAKVLVAYVQRLTASWEYERVQRERRQELEQVTLQVRRHNALMKLCVAQLQEPVTKLELPAQLEEKLHGYGGLGKLMMAFVLCGSSFDSLTELVGSSGVALVRAALLYKGYFTPEDMAC